MTEIVHVQAESLSIPMQSPFESARRRVDVAENVLVQVTLAGGVTGWGEGSPTPYVTGEDAQGVLTAVEAAAPALIGHDAARFERWGPALREAVPGATARSAVEMAVLDALTRSRGVPLWIHFGGAA